MAALAGFTVIRQVTALFMAVGYFFEQLSKVTEMSNAPNEVVPEDESTDADELADQYFDEEDLRFLADTFERVNQRFLDEIRSFDGLSGALLVAIFALFVLLLDKVESFTWWPIAALLLPTVVVARNFGGRLSFSPDPLLFQIAFSCDPADAVINLIENHKSDITKNAALRNRKRKMFNRSLALVIIVSLAAAGFKEYDTNSDDRKMVYERGQATPVRAFPRQGLQSDRQQDRLQDAQGLINAQTPYGLQLRFCSRADGYTRGGEDPYQTVGRLTDGPRRTSVLPLYISPASDLVSPQPVVCPKLFE